MIKATNSLGYFNEWRGRFQDGQQLFHSLCKQLQKHHKQNSLLFAHASSWLAIFKVSNGQSDLALELLHNAFAITEHSEEAKETTHLRTIAFVTQLLGQQHLNKDLDVASDWFRQSLAHYKKLDDKWGMAQIYRFQGDVQRLHADYAATSTLLQKSHNLYKALGDKRSLIDVLDVLSMSSRYAGQPKQAMQFSQECYALAQQINDKPSMAKALGSLAFSHSTGLGNFPKAVPLQEACVTIYQELGDLNNGAIEGARLGFLYSANGDFPKGEQVLRQNIPLLRQANLFKWVG